MTTPATYHKVEEIGNIGGGVVVVIVVVVKVVVV